MLIGDPLLVQQPLVQLWLKYKFLCFSLYLRHCVLGPSSELHPPDPQVRFGKAGGSLGPSRQTLRVMLSRAWRIQSRPMLRKARCRCLSAGEHTQVTAYSIFRTLIEWNSEWGKSFNWSIPSLFNCLHINKTHHRQTYRCKERESSYLSLQYNLSQSLRFGSVNMTGIRWSRRASQFHLSAATCPTTFPSSLLADWGQLQARKKMTIISCYQPSCIWHVWPPCVGNLPPVLWVSFPCCHQGADTSCHFAEQPVEKILSACCHQSEARFTKQVQQTLS